MQVKRSKLMSNIRLEIDLRISSHMYKTNFTASLEFEKSDNRIGKNILNHSSKTRILSNK